jgi:quinol-cytochrome oxidoreductase complex cytochrome b subunit
MSYWGATVITNLLSAIPFFGHDLVELKQITEYLNTLTLMSVLPTIGNVNVHALKKEIKYD